LLQITLKTPEFEKFVAEQVSAGSYRSAEDVVTGALALLRGQTEATTSELEELKAAIAVGMDEANRGLSEAWDADEIAAEAERRFGTERKTG
jgi:putative addiction module CopG family antidote